jgi:hypothetical protein
VGHDPRGPLVQAQAQGNVIIDAWRANALSKMSNGSKETSKPAPNSMI